MKMTAKGKFQGTELNEIPVWYLTWFLANRAESATPVLIQAIREQLESVKANVRTDSFPVEVLHDDEIPEEEEVALEDIPPEELKPDTTALSAELQQAKSELKRFQAEHQGIVKFFTYFETWYRMVHPMLRFDRPENHAAEAFFNQLKKQIDDWKATMNLPPG